MMSSERKLKGNNKSTNDSTSDIAISIIIDDNPNTVNKDGE